MITLRITPDVGEPYTVVCGPRDLLMWERTGHGRSLGKMSDPTLITMGDLYSLAYVSCQRQGRFSVGVTVTEFETSHEIEFLEGDDTSDPSRTAR